MKKLIILIIWVLWVPNCAWGAINELWPADAKAVWTDLWDDVPEHRFKDYVLTNANSSNSEGLAAAIAYQMTGNTSYADTAHSRFMSSCGPTGANNIRDNYVPCSIIYSLYANGTSAGNRTSAEALLENLWDNVSPLTTESKTFYSACCDDTDQMVGVYFGAMLHAAAIEDDDPTLYADIISDFGLVEGEGRARDPIAELSINYFDGGWPEGSRYSLFTVWKYMIPAVELLNDHYSGTGTCVNDDCFPEVTSQYSNTGDYVLNGLTSDFNDRLHFRDEETGGWGLEYTRMQQVLTTTAYIDDNPQVRYILNQKWNSSSFNDEMWLLFADDKSTKTAPSGSTNYNAVKTGINMWHEGWNPTDASVFIFHTNYATHDHTNEASPHFDLHDNGAWVIRTPYGYTDSEGIHQQNTNGFLPNNAMPPNRSEAREQTASRIGTDYSYSAFTVGGRQVKNNFYSPPNDHLKEWTNSILYRHNADGSHMFIHFDRVKNENIPADRIERYGATGTGILEDYINQYTQDSLWRMWMASNPTLTGSCAGGRVSWTQGGQSVYWDNKLDSCTYAEELAHDYGGTGFTKNSPFNTYYEARLQIPNTEDFQTHLNFIQAGSNPTTSKITSSAGTSPSVGAYYEAGTENVLAIFSAKESLTWPGATPLINGGFYFRNPNRIDFIRDIRKFTDDDNTYLEFTSDGNVVLFVADLDSNFGWNYTIDGGSPVALTVPSSGLATTTLTLSSGAHSILIEESGAVTPDCSNDPDLCTDNNVTDGCDVSGWCWEDRGGGFDCYDTCMAQDCDDNCTLCTTNEAQCLASMQTCYWWSTDECFSTQEPMCDSSNLDLCNDLSSCTLTAGANWCDDDGNGVFGCQVAACDPPTFAFEADDACMAMYNFSETSGDLLDICTGSGSLTDDDGTITGITTRDGANYTFDGVGDYIEIPTSNDIDFADESFSVCAKITYTNFTGTQTYVQKGNGGSGGVRYSWFLANNTMSFAVDDNVQISPGSWPNALFPGDTVYTCFVRNVVDNKLYFYVDGTLVSSADDNSGSIAGQNSQSLMIGSYCDSTGCPAVSDDFNPTIVIDDLFIMDRALGVNAQAIWINAGGLDESGTTAGEDQPNRTFRFNGGSWGCGGTF